MESAGSAALARAKQVVNAVLPTAARHGEATADARSFTSHVGPRRAGYGLPCSNCRTYYPADSPACPVCKSSQRVSATAAGAASPAEEHFPDTATLEEEREKFLREFKAQIYASHTQINAAASFRCGIEENHPDGFEPAAVCEPCYQRLQQRADVMEAALHMEVKEAAQIVYNAVWADSSDSSKTYQNAAQALLNELRRRAGISTVMGPNQPLTD